ncbi:MAG TPA: flavin reductase family protein [Chloroflexota bacterium]|nr:flavin reductase family protein [Chloroflexota bacterium]
MSEIFGRLGTPGEPVASDGAPLALDAAGARWLRRHQAAAVAALTTSTGGRFHAVAVSAFLQISTDPLLYLVSVESESRIDVALSQSGFFALNLLDRSQQFLADRLGGFAPAVPARFEGIPHFTAVTGAPILTDSIGWIDCRIVDELTMGDHTNIVGEAVGLGRGTGDGDDPLVYYRNKYSPLR